MTDRVTSPTGSPDLSPNGAMMFASLKHEHSRGCIELVTRPESCTCGAAALNNVLRALIAEAESLRAERDEARALMECERDKGYMRDGYNLAIYLKDYQRTHRLPWEPTGSATTTQEPSHD